MIKAIVTSISDEFEKTVWGIPKPPEQKAPSSSFKKPKVSPLGKMKTTKPTMQSGVAKTKVTWTTQDKPLKPLKAGHKAPAPHKTAGKTGKVVQRIQAPKQPKSMSI